MSPLGDRFRRLFSSTLVTDDQKRAAIAHAIGRCPSCSSFPTGHTVANLATAMVGPDRVSRLRHLTDLIESRAWDDLLRIQEWDPRSDVIDVLALKCPDNGMHVMLVDHPFEMWASDRQLNAFAISEPDSRELGRRVENQWTLLQTAS